MVFLKRENDSFVLGFEMIKVSVLYFLKRPTTILQTKKILKERRTQNYLG